MVGLVGQTDAVVVGAGVIGIAIARRLVLEGYDVVLLEAEAQFGQGVSARSSEVVHSGIYYPEHSIKARTCVAGGRMLQDYCRDRAIGYQNHGKLVVANGVDEIGVLERLFRQGQANGVEGLQLWDGKQARRHEPALRVEGALFCPTTAVVDSHRVMAAMLSDFKDKGGVYVPRAPVIGTNLTSSGGLGVRVGGDHGAVLACRVLVNAAGLGATQVARQVEGMVDTLIPQLRLAKGSYFSYRGKVPFSRLIYPVPEPGGLGIHLTLDQAGQARFGPDVEWVDTPNYTVDASRAGDFVRAIQRVWPEVDSSRLVPDYAGIRPCVAWPRTSVEDFLVQDSRDHGIEGLINLFGIVSPGLTASMALAEDILLRCQRVFSA
jgi:L-2-hydroxyglutarate oxidase LhgO